MALTYAGRRWYAQPSLESSPNAVTYVISQILAKEFNRSVFARDSGTHYFLDPSHRL